MSERFLRERVGGRDLAVRLDDRAHHRAPLHARIIRKPSLVASLKRLAQRGHDGVGVDSRGLRRDAGRRSSSTAVGRPRRDPHVEVLARVRERTLGVWSAGWRLGASAVLASHGKRAEEGGQPIAPSCCPSMRGRGGAGALGEDCRAAIGSVSKQASEPIQVTAYVTRGTPELTGYVARLEAELLEAKKAGEGRLAVEVVEASSAEAKKQAWKRGAPRCRCHLLPAVTR